MIYITAKVQLFNMKFIQTSFTAHLKKIHSIPQSYHSTRETSLMNRSTFYPICIILLRHSFSSAQYFVCILHAFTTLEIAVWIMALPFDNIFPFIYTYFIRNIKSMQCVAFIGDLRREESIFSCFFIPIINTISFK